MTAAPPVAPSVPDSSLNGSVPAHLNMNLSRFHPIAMNPSSQAPSDSIMQNHYSHYAPPPVQDQGLPAPHMNPSPSQLDHIETRLRQLEQEEAARMIARSRQLAIRKCEDEEFRRVTESAEHEEEDLRRQRKRLKRESMGLSCNLTIDSPPLLPTQPRRLSETNAATTLAFFKQQTSPEPLHQQHQQQQQSLPPPPSQAAPPVAHDSNAAGALRRKQKYTIKNVEAWGERHGRPAAHDPTGRALWKRPSDGTLVYLTCPIPGCGKDDFVTLHGFMCHLTKKHKDRSLGSQSRALEICGIVYDPNAPLPPVHTAHRDSTEESRLESAQLDTDGYDYSSSALEDDDEQESPYGVKVEPVDRAVHVSQTPLVDTSVQPRTNGSTKPSISSMIDHNPESDSRETVLPPSSTTSAAADAASGSYQLVDVNNDSSCKDFINSK